MQFMKCRGHASMSQGLYSYITEKRKTDECQDGNWVPLVIENDSLECTHPL